MVSYSKLLSFWILLIYEWQVIWNPFSKPSWTMGYNSGGNRGHTREVQDFWAQNNENGVQSRNIFVAQQ
jgi:hypothetical protein